MPNDNTLPAIIGNQLPAVQGETASSAVAAQSKAMVEARYVIALRMPRVWDQVRQDILHECRRPSFAHNKSAYYRKPIGAGVEGLGIRFVEVALRCMKNVLVETTMVYEDEQKEVQRVSVTDLESNITYPLDVRVSKTVERSKPMDDGSYISVRVNSYQKKTYTVPANDDDLLNKRAALISKAIRTLGLRIIPGDIQDEAEEIIKSTRADAAARDPDGERKKIADAFAGINVKAADLVEYLGHQLDSCSPTELVDLRGLYGAIKDGEATWASVMDNKREQDGGAAPTPKSGNDAIKDAMRKGAIDKSTGEVTKDAKKEAKNPGGAPFSYPELAARINQAVDTDALDIAISTIDDAIKDEKQRAELRDIARAKRIELD